MATDLPSYAEIVGVSGFTIGVLITVYEFAEVFAKPLDRMLADRRGTLIELIVYPAIYKVWKRATLPGADDGTFRPPHPTAMSDGP